MLNLSLIILIPHMDFHYSYFKVTGTIQDIENTLFSANAKGEVLILEVENKPDGFALFFHNYSTFLCRYGIYIEDIYVREQFRGHGNGKTLLKNICKIARDRNCGRVEWC